jgi:uncharacterized protein (UPF0333 family)
MEEKAQGSLEYLLIIGAAILVVAIVVVALTGVLGGTKDLGADADKQLAGDLNDLNKLRN